MICFSCNSIFFYTLQKVDSWKQYLPDLEWLDQYLPEQETLDRMKQPFKNVKHKIGKLSLPDLPEKVRRNQASRKECVPENYFSYFSTKT